MNRFGSSAPCTIRRHFGRKLRIPPRIDESWCVASTRANARRFRCLEDASSRDCIEPQLVTQRARPFGPMRGDQIRVADSDLVLTVEENRQAIGDEPTLGWGKTIRTF